MVDPAQVVDIFSGYLLALLYLTVFFALYKLCYMRVYRLDRI